MDRLQEVEAAVYHRKEKNSKKGIKEKASRRISQVQGDAGNNDRTKVWHVKICTKTN